MLVWLLLKWLESDESSGQRCGKSVGDILQIILHFCALLLRAKALTLFCRK